jgi:hypothetical protein
LTPSLDEWLAALERDDSLDDPHHLKQRAAVLDRLETWFPDTREDTSRGIDDATAPPARVDALRRRLEAADEKLFEALRNRIRNADGARALAPWLHEVGLAGGCAGGDSYDHLDVLADGILSFDAPDTPSVELPAEMVQYQPTPARHILDLVRRGGLTAEDVLVDLGSGLGHVPLLAAICTDARCIGIELEPAYVACARRAARALDVDNVRFDVGDARTTDFSIGTMFYLYTPFRGTVMRGVLDALRAQASRRAIRICTYGPCTPIVATEPWLGRIDASAPDRIALFTTVRADTA